MHRVSPETISLSKTSNTKDRPCPEGGGSKDNVHMEDLITDPSINEESQGRPDGLTNDFTSDRHEEKRYSFSGPPTKSAWNGTTENGNHACDRLVLLGLCFVSLASLVLTMLMLFGKVGPPSCDCTYKSDSGSTTPERLQNVQDLKENVTSLKVPVDQPVLETVKEMSKNLSVIKEETSENTKTITTKLEDMKLKYDALQDKIRLLEEKISTAASNNSEQERQVKNEFTALWTTVNSTTETIGSLPSLWAAVNTTNQGLENVSFNVEELDNKLKNTSTTPGPRGPPGYNGTQGLDGTPGSPGPPGPPGRGGNLTLCVYKKVRSPGISPGRYTRQEVTATETADQKFLGVNCDTNDARVCRLSSTVDSSGRRTYKCNCENTLGTGEPTMYCYLHYWQCTITT